MRFMLLMHAPRGTGDYQISSWAPEDLQAHHAHMMRMHQELTESGELVGGEGLAPPGKARIVRAATNGEPVVTDGPFPETKEFLAGYWMVDVESEQRAYEIAAQTSAAPGPAGTPMNFPMEVRQVMKGPDLDA